GRGASAIRNTEGSPNEVMTAAFMMILLIYEGYLLAPFRTVSGQEDRRFLAPQAVVGPGPFEADRFQYGVRVVLGLGGGSCQPFPPEPAIARLLLEDVAGGVVRDGADSVPGTDEDSVPAGAGHDVAEFEGPVLRFENSGARGGGHTP
ncbi:hypothetical protein Q7689_26300, partial [Nocardiopsis tropica]|nr:hypothetical protein [Nocardiopsis tropica]